MPPMQTQSVAEQSARGSERHGLGRHAHRRAEGSIRSIMDAMMPVPAPGGKRSQGGAG